jgi:hypothetical protein
LWGTLRQISAAAKSCTGIGVHDSINEVGQLIAPFTAAAVVNDETNQKNSVGKYDTPWTYASFGTTQGSSGSGQRTNPNSGGLSHRYYFSIVCLLNRHRIYQ